MPKSHDGRLASLIIENALEYAIFTMNTAGQITTWSRGAEHILGYSRDEAVGMDFAILFTAPDREAGAPAVELDRAVQAGRAEDTRWHCRKSGERFWANGVTMGIFEPELTGLLKILRDETPAKQAEDQRILLLNELNHRIKNTLATVQSITEQTLRTADCDPALRKRLTDRLMVLSQAHNVLVAESWAGADLGVIVDEALAAHQLHGVTRFEIDGPMIRLSPQQAVGMALVLHELATNAVKHGALVSTGGRVQVSWNLAHDAAGLRHMTLLWRETGGPPVSTPDRLGFGTRLISKTFGEAGAGTSTMEFRAEGLQCVIRLVLSAEDERVGRAEVYGRQSA